MILFFKDLTNQLSEIEKKTPQIHANQEPSPDNKDLAALNKVTWEIYTLFYVVFININGVWLTFTNEINNPLGLLREFLAYTII